MKRNLFTVVGLTVFLLPGLAPAQNAVTDWNNIAVKAALAGPLNSPNGIALYLAYVHLAIHDAVNAIEHRYKPYGSPLEAPTGASVEAAVAAAAYTTLQFHFPDQSATLTTQYNGWLAAIPDSGKADGVAVGRAAANQLLAMRASDGLGAKVPYTYPAVPTPGVWMLTPPTPPAMQALAPITPWMGQMVPFTMRSASQFFPEPPPPLSSKEWVDDYNQVKILGAIKSVRTSRQTEIALFWSENTAVQYARALRNLSGAYGLDLAETARLFALVWTSSADALIGCWNAKYQYSFWRPITAIRNGDIDGNPATVPDPSWTPLANTPAHPEYPSAHGCFTGAVADSLKQYFGKSNFTFIVSSTVTHTVHEIHSTRELEQEVEKARIYAGIHFHHSVVEGAELGRQVAQQAFRNFFEPEPGK